MRAPTAAESMRTSRRSRSRTPLLGGGQAPRHVRGVPCSRCGSGTACHGPITRCGAGRVSVSGRRRSRAPGRLPFRCAESLPPTTAARSSEPAQLHTQGRVLDLGMRPDEPPSPRKRRAPPVRRSWRDGPVADSTRDRPRDTYSGDAGPYACVHEGRSPSRARPYTPRTWAAGTWRDWRSRKRPGAMPYSRRKAAPNANSVE